MYKNHTLDFLPRLIQNIRFFVFSGVTMSRSGTLFLNGTHFQLHMMLKRNVGSLLFSIGHTVNDSNIQLCLVGNSMISYVTFYDKFHLTFDSYMNMLWYYFVVLVQWMHDDQSYFTPSSKIKRNVSVGNNKNLNFG